VRRSNPVLCVGILCLIPGSLACASSETNHAEAPEPLQSAAAPSSQVAGAGQWNVFTVENCVIDIKPPRPGQPLESGPFPDKFHDVVVVQYEEQAKGTELVFEINVTPHKKKATATIKDDTKKSLANWKGEKQVDFVRTGQVRFKLKDDDSGLLASFDGTSYADYVALGRFAEEGPVQHVSASNYGHELQFNFEWRGFSTNFVVRAPK